MRIENLWREMETEANTFGAAAWLTRFALPRAAPALLVAMETHHRRRALLLPLPKDAMPPQRDWPRCNGLEVFELTLGDEPHLAVRLIDVACADVFTALAEDIAPRIATVASAHEAAVTILGRLRRWQRFLAAGFAGLSLERQRGLFGELHVLLARVLPALGAKRAVAGWRSPHASHQDFQFSAASIEVKTTVAKGPPSVRIASERQLDRVGTRALYLLAVLLDERETDPGVEPVGQNLPDLVAQVKLCLAGETLDLFDDRLLELGYLQADASRYENRRFSLRQERAYRVDDGFPRIVESDLPSGVGEVSYRLELSACEPFAISVDEMLARIGELEA